MNPNLIKVAVVGGLAAVAGAGYYLTKGSNGSPEEDVAEQKTPGAPKQTSGKSPGVAVQRSTDAAPPPVTVVNVDNELSRRAQALVLTPDGPERTDAWAELVGKGTTDELIRLVEIAGIEQKDPNRLKLRKLAIEELSRRDQLETLLNKEVAMLGEKINMILIMSLDEWSRSKPAAAMGYWKSLPPGWQRDNYPQYMVKGLAFNGVETVLPLLSGMDPKEQGEFMKAMGPELVKKGASQVADTCAKLLATATDESRPALTKLASAAVEGMAKGNVPGAAAWVQKLRPEWITSDMLMPVVKQWSAVKPEAAADWLAGLAVPKGVRIQALNDTVSAWLVQDAGSIERWYQAHANQPMGDELARVMMSQLRSKDPAASQMWLKRVQRPADMPQ